MKWKPRLSDSQCPMGRLSDVQTVGCFHCPMWRLSDAENVRCPACQRPACEMPKLSDAQPVKPQQSDTIT